uniref:Myosin motor domain-containing protein n=1 Tax=Angiostrongylus cantonensis TaxID=6313 RepID=A0A0K0D9T0_ANGCA
MESTWEVLRCCARRANVYIKRERMDNYEKDPGWKYLRQSSEQLMAAATKKFDSKKNVWVADAEEGFIAAEIKSTKGDNIVVVTSKGVEKTIKKDEAQQMNPPKFEKTEDMANLTFLNDASVLHNLRQRYFSMMIYTYSGLFCVVINPYKRLPIYSESVCQMYMGRRRNEMPPHLFAVADEAYRNMQNDQENQSMLITGESGAGKTENTKKVISYFAMVGASQTRKAKKDKSRVSLEDQIVQTNPVLEAFGNAKTVRNNNSSRFGKFIRIHFNKAGKVAGGDIEHCKYLVTFSISRVIKQAPGERCYHIFYQIYSGAVKGLKGTINFHIVKRKYLLRKIGVANKIAIRENFSNKYEDFSHEKMMNSEKLMLDRPIKDYHFVAQAETTIDGVDDKEEMLITDEAFDIMKFSQQEKDELFAITAGIMHMGELKIKQRPREEQAELENGKEGELACKLFHVDFEKFVGSLLKPRVKVGSEWVNKGQNLEQVNWALGALAKALYARMFTWLINRCNKTLDAQDLSRDFFIGVLDIAGFEIFDHNSFEQLWINFVNEKLQQFFNHHMFVLEQEEYSRESIRWEFIDFGLDLQACIDLIEKPLGVISMLDEECIVPKATDLTLASKLNDQHLGKHPNFQKPRPPKGKQDEAHFAIIHYAGTVGYNVKGWLEKNKANKGNQLLSDLWADYNTQEDIVNLGKKAPGKKGKSASFMTVSMIYRESLTNLIHMLNQTHPHFIRCIIPNEQKKSGIIEATLVLNQLTCNGVLEGIRICRKDTPYLLLMLLKTQNPTRKPVFFKAGVLAHLEELREGVLSVIITKFQSACRHYLALCEYKRKVDQKVGLLVIQRNVRAWCTLRTWHWFKLYGKVKPLIKGSKKEEEMEKLKKKYKELEDSHHTEERKRKDVEAENARLQAEKQAILMQLERERDEISEIEERSAKFLAQKADIEKQNADLNDQLTDQEERNEALAKAKKKVEQDNETLKKTMADLQTTVKKQESEKQSKEHQIRCLQDEIASQDELLSKINKEKKHQEEVNRKLLEDIQAQEDKVNHVNKVKAKLESTLDDMENHLEREKRSRQDIEKQKRKVEGELKIAQEMIEEITRQKNEQESLIKKKDAEITSLATRLEDEQSLVAKLQRIIKELQARIQDLEEELEAERQSRSKAEKARNEMHLELEELGDRLDEAGGATQAQVELNKKREAELAKLRRDLEEATISNETNMVALRKKHAEGIAELNDQLDAVQKLRAKLENEKAQQQREIEDLQAAVDSESKQRQVMERLTKQLEVQLTDMTLKSDEQSRNIQELITLRGKLQSDNSELNRQLEDAESLLATLNRIKQQLHAQNEEARKQIEQETREKQSLQLQLANYQLKCEQLHEALDEEQDLKTELQRLISKANAEAQQWRARFEGEGMNRAEELEEARRKLAHKVQEVQEQLENANQKIGSLEKTRQRLVNELEDAQVDADRANSIASALEKKQKGFDKVVDEWRRKCECLIQELESSQRDTRTATTEAIRLRNQLDEAAEQVEGVRRENKALAQELKDITDQLDEGGKSVHDLQKIRRRLEIEKEELQLALDESEAALEAEEAKVLRAQVEVSQIRSEIEKRLQEKEEEFENTRKNHQRALESMQASLESESRGRTDLLRMKKKLESDINEFEIALDHANKANVDAQKNLKKYQDSVRELQLQVEEEQRQRDDAREQAMIAERRAQIAERARRQAEYESAESKETTTAVTNTNAVLSAHKKRLEGELQNFNIFIINNIKFQSSNEIGRLSDELRSEQEHAQNIVKLKKALESQVKDMQARLEEAEAQSMKGGKRAIAKLEAKCHELEAELEGESRRHAEAVKNLRNKDRRCRELQFQVDEDKKSSERTFDLIEKLQQKIRTYKRQVEDAETLAAQNLAKYRQLQHALEDAEERAAAAENAMAKMRLKNRSGSYRPLAHSISSTAVNMKSSSSSRGRLLDDGVEERQN